MSSSRPRSRSVEKQPIYRSLPPLPDHSTKLEDHRHYFRGDQLVSMDTNGPFIFNYCSDADYNNRRYHLIGKCVEQHVYHLLEEKCGLTRHFIPMDATQNEAAAFIFASPDFATARFLMLIIHGSGNVRAGQWSRKLIINNGLREGSQIEYIMRARQEGYAVIVTNTNMNSDELNQHSRGRIRGSGSPEEHAEYVWKNFVRRNPHAHICIVAHSYGGAVVLHLAERFTRDFHTNVFAVALTDSAMKCYMARTTEDALRALKMKTINWIADNNRSDKDLKKSKDYGQLRSAGHPLHEWTSHTAFNAIFQFFQQQRQRLR